MLPEGRRELLCRKTVLESAKAETESTVSNRCSFALTETDKCDEVFDEMSIFGDNDIMHISMHNSFTVDAVHLIVADESRTNQLC